MNKENEINNEVDEKEMSETDKKIFKMQDKLDEIFGHKKEGLVHFSIVKFLEQSKQGVHLHFTISEELFDETMDSKHVMLYALPHPEEMNEMIDEMDTLSEKINPEVKIGKDIISSIQKDIKKSQE